MELITCAVDNLSLSLYRGILDQKVLPEKREFL